MSVLASLDNQIFVYIIVIYVIRVIALMTIKMFRNLFNIQCDSSGIDCFVAKKDSYPLSSYCVQIN